MGGFLSNEISSQDEILLASSSDETHVQTEIFLSRGRDFIQDEISSWLHVNALLIFLVLLKYREIITVKTLILYNKTFFFSLKVLKTRKRSWH